MFHFDCFLDLVGRTSMIEQPQVIQLYLLASCAMVPRKVYPGQNNSELRLSGNKNFLWLVGSEADHDRSQQPK